MTPKEAKEAKAPPKKLKSKAEAAKMLADKKKAAEKMLEKEKEKKKECVLSHPSQRPRLPSPSLPPPASLPSPHLTAPFTAPQASLPQPPSPSLPPQPAFGMRACLPHACPIAEEAFALSQHLSQAQGQRAPSRHSVLRPSAHRALVCLLCTTRSDGDDGGGSDFVDDLVSQMDIETYIDCRVRPITDTIEKRAPTMSRRFNALEGLGLIANTSGAVLAIIELADWVAITVAIASVSMALNDYFYIPSQLAATNRAVQDLHNLLVWWDSLSLVQRKTRAVKLRCASTVEGAVLALCASRTAVSPALPNEQVEDEEEEKK